jgi:predicted metal-binding membrane protein
MAVCFAVGVAALPVMVALTVLMAAERLTSWGRALVRPVGVAAMALGAAILLGLLPAGPLIA